MKKLLALFMCLTIIASCASVSVCAAEIENLAGGPFDFENNNNAPFTSNATVVDKTAAGVDFVSANGSKVLQLTKDSEIKFSDDGIKAGIIEFTTDWYACNTKKNAEGTAVAVYGLKFNIGSSDNKSLPVLIMTRETKGSFASSCGGWSSNGMLPGKWWTMKITINVDGDNSWYEVAYKEPGADDSTYTNIMLLHVDLVSPVNKSDSTSYVKRYIFDGNDNTSVGKTNYNQKMLSDVNKITFTGPGAVDYNLFDNTSVKVYEPFYTAINKCTTADEVKAQLKLYKNLGIFDFGSEYTKVDDMNTVFSALIGQSFGSDAAVTNAYNAAVAANVNPYISERIVMDDLTESPVFSKGSLVTNTTIKPDGKFYMPAYDGVAGVNFANPVKKNGIIRFKSDIYVHYDNATRITPFGISMSNNADLASYGKLIASINRAGSFSTASSAWTVEASVKDNEWSSIEYLIDAESDGLRIKADGNEAAMPRSYSDYGSDTVINSYVYRYTGEEHENKHNMGVVPNEIYGLRFSNNKEGGKDKSLDYLANTDITVYKPLYTAVNEAATPEALAKAIDFYSNELRVFTKSDKEYSAEELYNALKDGKTYSSSREFADAYNNYVSAPVLTLGNISFDNGYPRYTNIMVNTASFTLKKDAVSYVALYASDGSLNGVYELPRITNEKTTGDGQRTYTYGDGITLVNWDAAITGETVVISKYNWDKAVTAKVFIWSKDSEGSAIIPVANSVKIK